MRQHLIGARDRLIAQQTAGAAEIRALDPKLQRGPAGTWFAAERLEVPTVGQGSYGPGYTKVIGDDGRVESRMIIPEGAELWPDEGRHPGEVLSHQVRPGLWIRHQGECYAVGEKGYAQHDDPNREDSWWMGRRIPGAPKDLPAHWRAKAEPRSDSARSYPRSPAHDIRHAGLSLMSAPAVSLSTEGAERVVTVRPSGAGGPATDDGAIRIRERTDGTLALEGWRLETTALSKYDHETLGAVAELATKVERQFVAEGDGAGARIAARLRDSAVKARTRLEHNAGAQAMRAFVEAGHDYPIPQLAALLARGISPADLGKVEAQAKASADFADPKAFAGRVAELVWPDRVQVTRTEVRALLDAALKGSNETLAIDGALGRVLLGPSDQERAVLSKRISRGESKKGEIALRASLARTLLDGGATATALYRTGLAASADATHRRDVVRAWVSMAAGARSREERACAYDVIKPELDTTYYDLGGAVLSAAAVVAAPDQRAEIARRADGEVTSRYAAFASGGILAKALSANTQEERRAAFQVAKGELGASHVRITICALTAMGLTASTPDEKLETLRAAREYSFPNWRDSLRGAALRTLAIVSCDDDAARRTAALASLDL
jgi:hypothetical protein